MDRLPRYRQTELVFSLYYWFHYTHALYYVNAKSILVLILAIIISTPIKRILLRKLDSNTFFVNYKAYILPLYIGVLMLLCTIEMASNSFNPFITTFWFLSFKYFSLVLDWVYKLNPNLSDFLVDLRYLRI